MSFSLGKLIPEANRATLTRVSEITPNGSVSALNLDLIFITGPWPGGETGTIIAWVLSLSESRLDLGFWLGASTLEVVPMAGEKKEEGGAHCGENSAVLILQEQRRRLHACLVGCLKSKTYQIVELGKGGQKGGA